MSEQDRIAFEVWFIDQLTTRHDCDETTARIYLKKNDLGVYVHSNTFLRYEGWQSATAEANKRMAELEIQNVLYKDDELEQKIAIAELQAANEALLVINDNSAKQIEELQANNNNLREALERIKQNKYAGISTASLPPIDQRALWAEQALSSTPAESLQAHDDELIEKCAKVCEENFKPFTYDGVAEAIRALKEVK